MRATAANQDFCSAPMPGTCKPVRARGDARRLLLSGLLLAGFVGFLPVLPRLHGGDDATSARDMTLAVQVRRALLEDPILGPLNLGVKVNDGTVVLIGPVPAPEVGQQALRKIAGLRGVHGVRSELYLSRDTRHEPINLPLVGEAPTRTQSASPNPAEDAPGTLTGRVPPIELPPSGRTATAQPPSRPEPPPPPRPAPPAPAPRPGVSLLAPVVDVPQVPPPLAGSSLAVAVERVRQGNPRFRAIRVDVEGTTVLLGGPGVPGEDVMALAQALSVVPGVERVRIRSVSPGR